MKRGRTSRQNLDLLNGSLVKDGADLEDLEVLLAVVGDGSLDSRVAGLLELDIKRRGGTRGSGGGQRGESGETSKELHDCGLSAVLRKLTVMQ